MRTAHFTGTGLSFGATQAASTLTWEQVESLLSELTTRFGQGFGTLDLCAPSVVSSGVQWFTSPTVISLSAQCIGDVNSVLAKSMVS